MQNLTFLLCHLRIATEHQIVIRKRLQLKVVCKLNFNNKCNSVVDKAWKKGEQGKELRVCFSNLSLRILFHHHQLLECLLYTKNTFLPFQDVIFKST